VIYRFIAAEKATFPVRFLCRRLGVSPSGFYAWQRRQDHPSPRAVDDARLTETIREIHRRSRGTYGAPRVHAELRLGQGIGVGRKRVARLMRAAGLVGVTRRRRVGCTRPNPAAVPDEDRVGRLFDPDRPDQLWVADITQHHAADGWVYAAVVIDAYSRMVIGWSIADHLRAELVCDALDMAVWRRRPPAGTVHHADHGTQYTSWAFGQRLRAAGLLASMGTVGDALDNAVAESFFATLQTELLDRHVWTSRRQLARGIFDYIETFYNPVRRHSYCGYLSPADYDHQARHIPTQDAA
jgi:putative transposase